MIGRHSIIISLGTVVALCILAKITSRDGASTASHTSSTLSVASIEPAATKKQSGIIDHSSITVPADDQSIVKVVQFAPLNSAVADPVQPVTLTAGNAPAANLPPVSLHDDKLSPLKISSTSLENQPSARSLLQTAKVVSVDEGDAAAPFVAVAEPTGGRSGQQSDYAVSPAVGLTILPSKILVAKSDSDVLLVHWLQDWEKGVLADGSIGEEDKELASLLMQTSQSPDTLVRVGQAVWSLVIDPNAKVQTRAAVAARPWYRQAILEAKNLSAGMDRGSSGAIALFHSIASCEHAFWQLNDGENLELLTSVELRLLKHDDPTTVMVRTAHAGSLYCQSKNDAALREISALAAELPNNVSPLQRVEIAWLEGLTLYEAGRYQEALPFVIATTKETGYKHLSDAWLLRVACNARIGNQKAANDDLDHYILKFNASPAIVSHLMDLIANPVVDRK